MKTTPKKLAEWLRGEEAMAALALFLVRQILAQAARARSPLTRASSRQLAPAWLLHRGEGHRQAANDQDRRITPRV